MSKSNSFEASLLQLIFQNANIADIGDATGLRGSSAAGSLYYALHTADPGEAGTQATNEISYTGYARVAVGRNGTNFTVASGALSAAAAVVFPPCTGGSGTATHFSVGVASSGSTVILYKGTLTPSIVVSNGVTPQINAGQHLTED